MQGLWQSGRRAAAARLHNELRPIHFINRGGFTSAVIQPAGLANHYKIVMFGKINFSLNLARDTFDDRASICACGHNHLFCLARDRIGRGRGPCELLRITQAFAPDGLMPAILNQTIAGNATKEITRRGMRLFTAR